MVVMVPEASTRRMRSLPSIGNVEVAATVECQTLRPVQLCIGRRTTVSAEASPIGIVRRPGSGDGGNGPLRIYTANPMIPRIGDVEITGTVPCQTSTGKFNCASVAGPLSPL